MKLILAALAVNITKFNEWVSLDRAGNQPLKKYWLGRIEEIREENRAVSSRLAPSHKLSHAEQVEFYSSWQYSATRLATSCAGLSAPEVIAERFGLPLKRVKSVLEFLLSTGLCISEKGVTKMGPARTHIPAESPLVARHHLNWRLKALEAHSNLNKNELAFTAPLSVAKKDREKVRESLLKCIQEINKIVETTEAQEVACLCIDWFDVRAITNRAD